MSHDETLNQPTAVYDSFRNAERETASGFEPEACRFPRPYTILVCDTQETAGDHVAQWLRREDFQVTFAAGGAEACARIPAEAPDLVLLNSILAGMSGYEVCRTIRSDYNGIIIFYSAEREETAQILAFDVGADDYIFKPQNPRVLASRLRAHLLRPRCSADRGFQKVLRIGSLFIDAGRREARMRDRTLVLTSTQFDLLWYLAKRAGRVVSREEIYRSLLQCEYDGVDRSLDVYISRIRQKLGESADHPVYLKTIRGVGYMIAKL